MTDEKIVDKLKKLKAMADSAEKVGNEAEAQAFATMVQTLLAKHKLDATDIEWEAQRQEELIRVMVDQQPTHAGWEVDLATIVAKACCCQTLLFANGRKKAKRIGPMAFFGTRTDAEAARDAFTYLHQAAKSLAERHYVKYFYECKEQGDVTRARGYKGSWLLGFVHRLSARYRENEVKIQSMAAGTAIIRLSQALARVQKESPAKGRTTSVETDQPNNYHGYKHGIAAANKVRLANDPTASERQIQ